MGILDDILKDLPDDNDEKMRMLCDQIFQEKEQDIYHKDILPKGPNIFLTLEVPGRIQGEIAFLSLEREFKETYLIVLFTITKKQYESIKEGEDEIISFKRSRIWNIDDRRTKQIVTEYAKQYKFLRGK